MFHYFNGTDPYPMEYQGKPFFIRGMNVATKKPWAGNLWRLEEGQIIIISPGEGYVHIPPGKRVIEYVSSLIADAE